MGEFSDKMSGKAKEVTGRATNNKEVEAKGRGEEMRGGLKGKIKDAGDKISDKIDDIKK